MGPGEAVKEGTVRANALLFAFAIAALVLVAMTWRLELVFDDAYISFRYSKHFASGEGLRFNLGTDSPVEGYSNFLWVLWCAIPEWLSLDTPSFAQWSNLVCGLALLGLVLHFVNRRFELSPLAMLATALFLAGLPPMAVYSTGGLETMASALAIFACFERLVGDESKPHGLAAGVAGLAAVLLRPDGALWIALVTVLCGWQAWQLSDHRLRRAVITAALIGAIGFALHTAWRVQYYGDWLPNTARAKASFSTMTLERGGKYSLSYWLNFPTILLVMLGCIPLAFTRRSGIVLRSLLFVLATLAYSILVGGDFLPMGRFLLPGVPFVALLFAALTEKYLRQGKTLSIAGALLFLCLSALPSFDRYLVPSSIRESAHYNWNFSDYLSEIELLDGERRRAVDLKEMGRALKAYARPGDSLVLGTVGAAGYYSELFIFDQFGLVNREVAALPWHGRRLAAGHDRYAPAKFFAKWSPTYLQASLVDLDQAGNPVPAGDRTRPGRRVIPLKPEDGFRPHKALLLIEGD